MISLGAAQRFAFDVSMAQSEQAPNPSSRWAHHHRGEFKGTLKGVVQFHRPWPRRRSTPQALDLWFVLIKRRVKEVRFEEERQRRSAVHPRRNGSVKGRGGKTHLGSFPNERRPCIKQGRLPTGLGSCGARHGPRPFSGRSFISLCITSSCSLTLANSGKKSHLRSAATLLSLFSGPIQSEKRGEPRQ